MHVPKLLALPLLLIGGCGQPTPTSGEAVVSEDELNAPFTPENLGVPAEEGNVASVTAGPSLSLSSGQARSVCKAVIAEMFGHSPKIMKAHGMGDLIRVTYDRPDDGKRWTNDCRLDGNRIMWRGVESGRPMRWRDHQEDEAYTFRIDGRSVKITTTYSDGSIVSNNQPLI